MNTIPTTDEHEAYWRSDPNIVATKAVVIGGPPSEPDCVPAPAVLTLTQEGATIVRVPLKLDEIELAHLAKGGTVWLSTWGHLPMFMLEVQEPS